MAPVAKYPEIEESVPPPQATPVPVLVPEQKVYEGATPNPEAAAQPSVEASETTAAEGARGVAEGKPGSAYYWQCIPLPADSSAQAYLRRGCAPILFVAVALAADANFLPSNKNGDDTCWIFPALSENVSGSAYYWLTRAVIVVSVVLIRLAILTYRPDMGSASEVRFRLLCSMTVFASCAVAVHAFQGSVKVCPALPLRVPRLAAS